MDEKNERELKGNWAERQAEEQEVAQAAREAFTGPAGHGRITAMVEELVNEEIVCEWRDGEAWFVFHVAGKGHRRAAYPADPFLELLLDLRRCPLPRPKLSDQKVYGVRHDR